jgi:hypothetical protein
MMHQMTQKEDKLNFTNSVSIGKKTLKPVKKRRKISRRKPGQKATKKYFTHKTQEAIVEYQNTDCMQKKERIYVKEILPAFDDLVENLINVYGFKVMYETKQDLKNECLEFLYSAVHKFDAEKGSKAFSYFNVVAKNWLTIKSKQNAKKIKQHISLDNKESISQSDLELIEKHNFVPGYDDVITTDQMKQFLERVIDQINGKIRTDNEKLTIDAIKHIKDNLENLDYDMLSKRAILLYIRNITNLNSKQLSIVLSNLKKHYREIKKQDELFT